MTRMTVLTAAAVLALAVGRTCSADAQADFDHAIVDLDKGCVPAAIKVFERLKRSKDGPTRALGEKGEETADKKGDAAISEAVSIAQKDPTGAKRDLQKTVLDYDPLPCTQRAAHQFCLLEGPLKVAVSPWKHAKLPGNIRSVTSDFHPPKGPNDTQFRMSLEGMVTLSLLWGSGNKWVTVASLKDTVKIDLVQPRDGDDEADGGFATRAGTTFLLGKLRGSGKERVLTGTLTVNARSGESLLLSLEDGAAVSAAGSVVAGGRGRDIEVLRARGGDAASTAIRSHVTEAIAGMNEFVDAALKEVR